MNRTKIFAILVGALNAAVPVRGQDNVEPDCRGKRSTAFAAKQQGRRRCRRGRMNGKTQFFDSGFANLARNTTRHKNRPANPARARARSITAIN